MTLQLLHHLLERAAESRSDAVAVVDGDRSITYGQLDRRANQLAHLLGAVGVRPGDRVGVYLPKSLEAVVGVYGALKAGAAYVPLDPEAPPARLAQTARNCTLRCLVTGSEMSHQWGPLVEHGAPLETLVVANRRDADLPAAALPLRGTDAIETQPVSSPDIGAISLDLAYILYTSGSTGSPKGVILSHLNALAFVSWAVKAFGIATDDRLSSHAPFHFDLSVLDLFAAAAAGAAVVLVPPQMSMFPVELRRYIEASGMTIWYSVPSVLTMLQLRGGLRAGDLPRLRRVLFAGEVFPTKFLRGLMEALPHVRFANLYGPTETNVCTWYNVPSPLDDHVQSVPIGRAIADVEVFAVTDDGRRAEAGEVGELHVRGATVTRGYWGEPAETARALIPNPFREGFDVVYRTGDLVQLLESGDYRFVGRRDSQVKSRGHRIELGEIEAVLQSHPDVVECAVVAIPDEMVSNRIRAYAATGGGSEARLLAFCADRLPRYMVPESIDLLAALPRTSTGKVDRQALAVMAPTGAALGG